jgi:hypothetical protein
MVVRDFLYLHNVKKGDKRIMADKNVNVGVKFNVDKSGLQ